MGRLLGQIATLLLILNMHVFAAYEAEKAAINSGDAQSAFDALISKSKGIKNTAEFDYLLGVSAYKTGRYDIAIDALQRVLTHAPENSEAQVILGDSYLKLNSVAEANDSDTSQSINESLDYRALQSEIKQGNAEPIYTSLNDSFDEHAGIPEFDFTYGLAALDSQHYEDAVFSFERVLFSEPKNYRARLELGRAYYTMGNDSAAQREFTEVLNIDPPQQVVGWINKYQEAIKQRQSKQSTQWTINTKTTSGVDSNINSAPSPNDLAEIGGNFTTSTTEIDDEYWEVSGALSLLKPLSKSKSLFAGANFAHKNNLSTDEFDTTSGAISAGFQMNWQVAKFRFPIQAQTLYRNNEIFRNYFSISAQALKQLNRKTNLTATMLAARSSYPDLSSRDVNVGTFALATTYRVLPNITSSLQASRTMESAVEDNASQNNRGITTVSVNTTLAIRQHTVSLSGTYQDSGYEENYPTMTEPRAEELLAADLRWTWRINKKFTFASFANYSQSDSNIDTLSYDKSVYGISASASF